VEVVPTPAVVGYETNPELIGAPFFVMEKIDGLIPSDNPSWGSQGFIFDATAEQRQRLWERTVGIMAELHRTDAHRFDFLRTRATDDGVGDCLDLWMRSLRWADLRQPIPLTGEAEEWLISNRPIGTALSWGDSRPPNVIYRDFEPVALLDWDLVSLAGPQADLAWWILMTPAECLTLDGIGTHDELVDLWEDLTDMKAVDLHWFLVFGAYRLAAILAKLLPMFVAQGRMPAEIADQQLTTGMHVALLAGLLDLTPPAGVTPVVPDVRWDRR
jgi:aminoglycoside phosphotransferase (APT) family kinase protein